VSHDKKPSLDDLYPLPEGVKVRTRKFGANPVTPLQPTRPAASGDTSGPGKFMLRHEAKELGLLVIVQEQENSGLLTAEVFSSHSDHLNQAAVFVALVGTIEDGMIRKTIPLVREIKDGEYRCSGSANFGSLRDAVQQLGNQLGLIVFLVV
jgi:hypothetical protein